MKSSFRFFICLGFLSMLLAGCNNSGQDTTSGDTKGNDSTGETTSVVPAHDHIFGNWVIDRDATEYEAGLKHHDCTICGYRVSAPIDKLPHTHKPGTPVEENRVEADCTHDGSYDLVTYCTECLEEVSREHESISATGHQHFATREENRIEADCTNDGSYDLVTYCTDDNVEISREHKTIHALGHDLFHHSAKAATAEEDGYEAYDSCTRCDYSTKVVIPATGTLDKLSFGIGTKSYSVRAKSTNISGKVVIPAFYNGKPVDMIHPLSTDDYTGAFKNCTKVTSIVIGSNIQKIPDSAFLGCTALTSINIPASVQEIGKRAFSDCSALTSPINIPNGITTIQQETFYNCSKIPSVHFPESLTTISAQAFKGCSSLTSINIPDNVYSIESSAFSGCSSLSQPIVIPERVTYLHSYAFYGCSSLTSITIHDGLTIGGTSTFPSNPNLTIYCKVSSIETFMNNNSIGSSIPEPVKIHLIDKETNEEIKSIDIPNSLESIGKKVFYNCSSIENVTIPEGITTIGDYAFRGCESLKTIVIPEGITTIGQYAFAGCESIETMVLPDSVTTISDGAFDRCPNLDLSLIVSSFEDIKDTSIRNIGHGVHLIDKESNQEITEIAIPETYTYTPMGCFRCCSYLTSVTLHNKITWIGNDTFEECTSLKEITIPKSVTEIGECAFYNCTSLETVYFTGTKYQWTQVQKTYMWSYGVPATVIHCSDGDTRF